MSQAVARPIAEVRSISWGRPRLLVLLVYIALLCTLALFYVWSRLQVMNLEYEIASLGNEVAQLQREEQTLRIEVASLENPSRVERLARQKLGLQRPSAAQIKLVER
ncbi:MAG: cell division protein FtsL [Desulfuromonas sp.]|nr:MAG: cell division protein FtsL [Desulfuromonas sp.]